MKRHLLLGHLVTLFLGSSIYICFRTDTLLMFKWFDNLNMTDLMTNIRHVSIPYKDYLADWVLFSLPDGLWLFSYVSLILYIWDKRVNMKNITWLTIIPIIAILSELGQFFSVIPGTFDIADLTFYLIGTVLPFVIFNFQFNYKTKTT